MAADFDFTGEFYRCTEHNSVIEICDKHERYARYIFYDLEMNIITRGNKITLFDWKHNLESGFYKKDLTAINDAIVFIAKEKLKEEENESIRV